MAIAGKGGSAKLGANTVAEVSDWKLDIDADMLDTTNMGSGGWKEFIAGLKSWAGSVNMNWKVSADATGQKAIQDAYLAGTTLTLDLLVNATNKYSGSVLIKKLSIGAAVNGLVTYSVDIQGTGQLSYT